MPRSRKYDGVVYRRKETPFWWIRYRDRSGARRRESTFTQDWQEAQQLLRERLQARDNNVLDVIRKGEKLSLEQWADFFLENYSKPPVRAERMHQVNLRVAKHIKGAFGPRKLVEITADDIELSFVTAFEKRFESKPRSATSKWECSSQLRFIRS
jgi:hypothetical protein